MAEILGTQQHHRGSQRDIKPRPAAATLLLVFLFVDCFSYRAAEIFVIALCKECFHAVLAQPQAGSFVCQHEAEHHLDRQQQGMKIPHDGGTLPQLDVVVRCDASERRHTLPVNVTGVFVHFLLFIEQEAAQEGKGPVLKGLLQPVVALRIVAHEAHDLRLRLLTECHCQRNHGTIPIDIP